MTLWQSACENSVIQIKWSSVYFEDIMKAQNIYSEEKKGDPNKTRQQYEIPSKYKSILSDFYAIDSQHIFYIWNLIKSVSVNFWKNIGKLLESGI